MLDHPLTHRYSHYASVVVVCILVSRCHAALLVDKMELATPAAIPADDVEYTNMASSSANDGENSVCDAGTPSKNCFRLVLLGSSKVGKTALVTRFLDNRFDDKYTPTIENFHRKIYNIRGESYRLDLLDTSGNNPFPAMRRLSLMTGQ